MSNLQNLSDDELNALEYRLRAVTVEAREAGYAITWWSPEEVGDLSARKLTDRAVEAGNDFIADYSLFEGDET